MSDMMVSAECRNRVDEQIAERDTGIVSRWNGILNTLLEHNVAYERPVIHVDELFTHPKNRGGLGLNQHNVQKNITDIATVGADKSKLAHACAFEMSTVPGRREKARRRLCNHAVPGSSDGCDVAEFIHLGRQ